MNTMSKIDWKDYANYLQSQTSKKNLTKPSSIGEAVNNYNVIQDLEDVNTNKINVEVK